MNEPDAFFSYDIFLRKNLPVYVQPSLEGVHEGVKVMVFYNWALLYTTVKQFSSVPSSVC